MDLSSRHMRQKHSHVSTHVHARLHTRTCTHLTNQSKQSCLPSSCHQVSDTTVETHRDAAHTPHRAHCAFQCATRLEIKYLIYYEFIT